MDQSEIDNNDKKIGGGRRKFLKLGLAGAGVAAAAASGVTVLKRMEGIPHDHFPLPVRDDFKPIDQRNQINVFGKSKILNDKHPERNSAFNKQLKKENPQGFKEFNFCHGPGSGCAVPGQSTNS
jgi:epoxyqueuosine reductase